ncbi:putative glycosyltransferase [Corynebacterium renale]|uniref:Galactofuranosylgalactofuranosylrhamnosyl-N-acetylglucosaminyl-diphospho-decaprenol beta-1,5/1,6-galactofuranosyltransferase n=1 Tax=Corynebacterium renale TaxID=1724 RepID=A0A2A9DPA9_9CORY|nr:glycosyltransferase [Corynebacterium renale]PFG27822.1 galactofuranosylgalactofuranosylrhamnosyl-N-acetylglucosaminyl-diphospho-decaprenol beta-1,5/1,6-galactofuranosyltransferase [Corynebacterium renale]SQI22056.1 putative glycosyltransferase [Corynebacterium renale]
MSAQPVSTEDKKQSQAVEQLQRLLLPKRGEPADVRMLYLMESTSAAHERLDIPDRFSVTLPAGAEVSFETYFNAFPASYWKRWSQLEEVVLKLHVAGQARIDVYRSRTDGGRIGVDNAFVQDGDVEFVLPLKPFEDGGWYWFDVTAETEATVSEGGWFAAQEPGPQTMPDGTQVGPFEKAVTVGIPTFNRPADAVAALQALASDEEVDGIIKAMLMPDQGTKHPADEPGYKEITEHFGDRFFEYRQGNLGGSGGYSRIMFEAVGENTPETPYILYMDDDIAIEPDSVLRAVQVARYAKSPIIVGGQMLNLLDRAELRTMGEVVDRHTFMWAPAEHSGYDHNFAEHPMNDLGKDPDGAWIHYLGDSGRDVPANSRNIHRRVDVDYNGWWMCMFPTVVAQQIGQPLPLFIKWDDTEYSLRAGEAGFPTATWPGVAIWHMSWADKDDAIDWQAYFHLRNRLIVAAMYHHGSADGIIKTLQKSTFKHLMCMEYSTLRIQIEAIKDFLAGPEQLFDILESSLPRIQAIRKEYPDAQILPSATVLPQPSGAPGVPKKDLRGPTAKLRKLRWLIKGVQHSLKPADERHHEVPQANLALREARWFSLSRLDGATVTTADGTGVAFRKRDRELAKELLQETRAVHKELKERFEEMKGRYRAAMPELTSRESWARIFDAQHQGANQAQEGK